MKTLLGALVAMMLSGCLSQARAVRSVEASEPVVGDLHCAAPRLSLLEALYLDPAAPAAVHCQAPE